MKKLLLILLTLCMSIATLQLSAQGLEDYTFSTGTDATKWIQLSTTTSLISAGAGDYGVSTVHNLGISFQLGEDTYTQFSVNADGNLRFGSTVTGTSNYSSPFNSSNAGVNAPKINFLGCDGFLTDSGHVYHEVVGTAPNRICVIEFATSTYTSSSRNSLLRWQVQLFEGSNNIQIVYASTQPPILPATTRQQGISIDGSHIWLVNANHQATYHTAGQTSTIASGSWPDVNRFYLFSAPVISCPKVTAFAVSTLDASSAELTWTPVGTESLWDIYVASSSSDIPDANSTPTDYAYTPSYPMSDLTPNTTYTVYVRANCDAGEVSNWLALTFATPCDAVTELPLSDNFDSYTGTTATSGTTNLPDCWDQVNTGTSSYMNYPVIYNGSSYAASGSNSLRFYTYYTTTYGTQGAVLPPIDASSYPINTLQVSFDARAYSTSYTFVLVVGIYTDPSDQNSFVPIDTLNITSTSYSNYEVLFNDYTGEGNRIAFVAPHPSSGYNYGNVDNIVVEPIPTCPKPNQLSSNTPAPTTSSITLSWNERGTATSWNIEYGPAGFAPGQGTTVAVTENPYTINDLIAGTVYDFYVQSDCGGGDESSWSSVHRNHTACGIIETIPYTNNFDYYGTGESAYPYCWSKINTYSSNRPYINTTHYEGVGSLYFYASSSTFNMAITPEFDASIEMNTLQANFMYRGTNSTDRLIVGFINSPTDTLSFFPIDTIFAGSSPTTWREVTVMFNEYTGNAHYIAFKNENPSASYVYAYIDNLSIEPIPSCIKPTSVHVTNVSASSITVDWTPIGEEGAWEVVAVPNGEDVTTGAPGSASTHPFTVEGLEDDTQYDIYVRADCGGGDYSYWSLPAHGTTNPLCSAPVNVTVSQIAGTSALLSWESALYGATSYTIEYSEANQDSWIAEIVDGTQYMISDLEPTTNYEVMVYSNCDNSSADTIHKTFTTGCIAGGTILIGDGTSTTNQIPVNNFYRYTYSQQIYLASEMNGAGEIHSVSFHYSYATASTKKTNVVIYMGHTTQSTFSGASDYIPLSGLQQVYSGNLNCTQGWNTFNFSTPFQYNGTDNLVIAVDDNSNDYDGSSYTFYVHNTGSNYRSIVYYSDSNNPAPSDPTAVSTNTNYSSGNRNNIKFGMECDNNISCAAPNVYVAETSESSITLDWAPGYTENEWEIEYSLNDTDWTAAGSTTTHPFELSSLDANTKYYIRIRSNCGSLQSDWVKVTERTACSDIDIPYAENFEDAPGSGSGNMITCWTRKTNNTSTAYPYTSNSQHHSGTYSVYFYGTSSYYSYLATPRFDDNVMMDNLQVRFWAYKSTASYYIQVGIMTDPNDPSTFVQVGQNLSPDTINTWRLIEVNTDDYVGEGQYIAFRIPVNITSYMYIDDIEIDEIPTCAHVEDIHANNVTAASADIVWTPVGDETEWQVVYGPVGTISNPEEETATTVSTPSISLNNLSSNTVYDVRVKSVCSADERSFWMEYTFRTACGDIIDFPLTENFELLNTGSSSPIYCWTRYNSYSSTTNYPYVNTTYAHSGNKSLYFYSGSGTFNQIALPPLDQTIDANTLSVSFWMRSASITAARMTVGVMTDPTDSSTFVPVQTVAASATNTWEPFEVSLASYTGTGSYIAFRNLTTSTYAIYMDDIIIDLLPSCPKPTNLTAQGSTSDTITLAWTDPTGTMWDVIYGPAGFDPDTSTTAEIEYGFTTNSGTITGLQGGITYDFYVRSDCGNGDVSPWCFAPATASPYTFQMGITGSATLTGCGFTVTDDGGVNGSYSNSCNYTLTIYPTDNTLLVSVSGTFAGESTIDYLSVYEGTTTSGELLQKITSGTSGTVINFGPLTSESGPLTLLFHSDVSVVYPGFVANVSCVPAPTCRKPYDLATVDAAADNVTVSWVGNDNAGSYNLALSTTANFNPATSTDVFVAYDTTYLFTSLSSNTIYYYAVQSDCGNDDVSDWSDIASFSTTIVPATVPYFNDFEDGEENAEWTLVNTTTDNRWYIGKPTNSTDSVLYVSSNNGSSATYGNTANQIWAYRDLEFPDAAEFDLRFKWACAGESTYDYMYAFIGTPTPVEASTSNTITAPAGSIQLGGEGHRFNLQDTMAWFSYPISSTVSNSIQRLYFVWRNDPSVQHDPSIMIDSIIITASNCGRPYDIEAITVDATSATIEFTPATESDMAWEYVIGQGNFNPDNATDIQTIQTTTFDITGLTANTTYTLYVRTNCGGGEYSAWSTALSFTTACDAATIPIVEHFDNMGTGSSVYPSCWSRSNTYSTVTQYPYVNSSYHVSGNASLYFYCSTTTYNVAVLPAIDPTTNPIGDLMLSFSMRSTTSTTSKIIVGAMTNPDNINSFIPIDTVNNSTTGTFEYFEIPLNRYTGDAAYVAMKLVNTSGLYSVYIDDVVLDFIPSCPKPTNLTSTAATTTSVTLSWTPGGEESSWEIIYGDSGFDPEDEGTLVQNVNASTYTVTNLTASTSYDFYVRAVCTSDDQSAWSSVHYAATNCEALTVPYTEDFNSYQVSISSSTAPSSYPNDILPTCWSFLNRSTSTSTYPMSFLTAYSSYAVSGNCLFLKSSSSTPLYAVLPEFTNNIQDLQLIFTYRNEGTGSSNGTLSVGYMTNPADASSFTTIETYTQTTTLTTDTVVFSTVPATAANAYIAFKYTGGSSNNYYLSIDNVQVNLSGTPSPTCNAPTGLTVNDITTNSATMTWTAGGSETSWKVGYKTQSTTQWQEATVNTTSYNLEGLTANTNYDVRVKAICANNNESDFISTSFSTLVDAINDVTLSQSISLMPNPADNYIELRINSNVKVKEAVVYNAFGQTNYRTEQQRGSYRPQRYGFRHVFRTCERRQRKRHEEIH